MTPDGQRFLLLEPAVQEAAPVTHLNVVLNWFEEVKRKSGPGLVQGRRQRSPWEREPAAAATTSHVDFFHAGRVRGSDDHRVL